MIFELVREFGEVLEAMPKGHARRHWLELLEEAIRRDLHFMDRHQAEYPQALFQCLWNSCWWYDCPDVGRHYDPPANGWGEIVPPWERSTPELLHKLLEGWRREKEEEISGLMWVRALRPPPMRLGTPQWAIFPGFDTYGSSVAFSPDGAALIAAGREGFDKHWLRLWDIHTGEEIAATPLPGELRDVRFSPDSRMILGGSGSRLQAWDSRLRPISGMGGQDAATDRSGISADVRFDVEDDWERRVRSRSIRSDLLEAGTFAKPIPLDDNRYAASQSGSHAIFIWQMDVSEPIKVLTGHTDAIHGMDWSAPLRLLASTSADGTIRLWDLTRNEPNLTLRGAVSVPAETELRVGGSRDKAPLISPDGSQVVLRYREQLYTAWHLGTLEPFGILNAGASAGRKIGPANSSRLGAEGDKALPVLHVRESQQQPKDGHAGEVYCVAFSRDAQHVATGGTDRTVKIWHLGKPRPRLLHTLQGHEGQIKSVAFSPDGKQVASTGLDRSIRIWDAETGKPILALAGHKSASDRLVFSCDGRLLFSFNRDCRIWDAHAWSWLRVTDTEHGEKLLSNSRCVLEVAGDGRIASLFRRVDDKRALGWYAGHVSTAMTTPNERTLVGSWSGSLHTACLEGELELASDSEPPDDLAAIAMLPVELYQGPEDEVRRINPYVERCDLGDVTVLRLTNPASRPQEFGPAVRDYIGKEEIRKLVLHLGNVEFIGKDDLGTFIRLNKLIQSRNGKLVFCRIDPVLMEVFEITKLDKLFNICDEEIDALQRF